MEFSYSEDDSGSNVEEGLEASEVSSAAVQARGKRFHRDLAANICVPAGRVTLFVPCPQTRKPCKPEREVVGENVWLHSSTI